MTLLVKTVPLNTNGSGDALATVRAGGCRLHAIDVSIGDLEAFDLTVTEEPVGTSLLGLSAVAADARYLLAAPMAGSDGSSLVVEGVGSYAPPVVLTRIQIVVASGGDHKSGELTLILER